VVELKRRLGKDSSNSHLPPSSDGPASPRGRSGGLPSGPSGARPGKQPGAPGAHLAQVAEPDELAWHVPDRCGADQTLVRRIVEAAPGRSICSDKVISFSKHRQALGS
jgi:transposase